MAINERLIHTASDSTSEGSGNQEEGLILHLDANDVDSYDGTGTVWYDISDHEFAPSENPEEHFNTVAYTGTGTSNDITGVGFQPDLVWMKRRSSAQEHALVNSVRGTFKHLYTDLTNAEVTTTNGLSSFDSDGFTVGQNGLMNNSGDTYVAWCFKAGGAPTATNTGGQNPTSGSKMVDGSADNTAYPTADTYPNKLTANTKLGFSIVEYTASLTAAVSAPGHSIPHGLNQPPEMIIWKSPDRSSDWWTAHKELSNYSNLVRLNTNGASNDYYSSYPMDAPTNSVFYTNWLTGMQHVAGEKTLAYCFHSVRGISKVGAYDGSYSSTPVEVYTGFEPAFIMVKSAHSSGHWTIHDNKRGADKQLLPSANASETSGWDAHLEFTRDGFTVKGASSGLNKNEKMLYYAVAKNTNETELVTTTTGVWSGLQSAVSSITSDSTSTTAAPGINESSTTSSMFNQTNYWSMGNNGNSEASNEIFITLNAAKSIKGYAVYEMYQSNYRYTGTTKLYGSTDNSTWTLLGSTVQSTSVQYNRNETTFAATPEYQYYKLTMSANNRGTYQGAWELEFLVDEDITPSLHLDAGDVNSYDPDTDGSTWSDLSSGNHDVTLTSMNADQHDKELGGWFEFDASADYGTIPHSTDLNISTSFTVEAWVNRDDDGEGYIISKAAASNPYGWFLQFHNNSSFGYTFQTYNTTPASFRATATIAKSGTAGKWQHVVGTCDGSNIKIYVDGDLKGTTAISGTLAATTTQTVIGAYYNYGAKWDGKIGQIRIYQSALSAEAIRQNFNYTKSSYPNGMHFDNAGGRANWLTEGSFNFDTGQTGGEYFKIAPNSRTFLNALGYAPFAVSAWVYPDEVTSGYRVIIGTQGYSDGSANGWQLYANQDDIEFWINVGGTTLVVNLTGVLTAGTWSHVLIQRTETKWEGYVDGQLVSNASSANETVRIDDDLGHHNPSDAMLIIGRNWQNTNYQWNGRISEVKIYNKSLSANKIQVEYNKGQFGNN